MSDTIEQNNNATLPLISARKAKIQKVYTRATFNASKNIFNPNRSSSSEDEPSLQDEAISPSMAMRQLQDFEENNSKKAFISFIHSYHKLNKGTKIAPNFQKIPQSQNIKENKPTFLSAPNDARIKNISENSEDNQEKKLIPQLEVEEIGTLKANKTPKTADNTPTDDKKTINKFKKREKVNLFKLKNFKIGRSTTTGTNSYGEYSFMKPKFLKSVTSCMEAESQKVMIHFKNLAEKRIPGFDFE